MAVAVAPRRKKLVPSLMIGSLLLATAACKTTNQDVGTIIGGVVGAGIGTQIGDGSGRIVAVIVGAAAGAWIGNQIGQYLDEQDQKELAAATQKTAVSGESQSWSNPDSGVTGRTRVVSNETRRETVDVPVLRDRVKELPPFEYVGERYRAANNVNVRGGPGTDYEVVSSVDGGQLVDVIGEVEGKPWYLVGDNGVGNGFIYKQLLQPTGQASTIMVSDQPESSNVSAQQAVASRNCRTIEQVVVLKDGSERAEQVTACEGNNGWEIV